MAGNDSIKKGEEMRAKYDYILMNLKIENLMGSTAKRLTKFNCD